MGYIAIDIGTTVCKTALYDEGGEVDIIRADYPLYADGKEVEQDAEDWFIAVKKAVLALIKKHGGRTVEAICAGSQGITAVPVDRAGRPLRRAISWLDTRAAAETAHIEKRYGAKEIFAVTGKKPLPYYTLPKLLRLKEREGELYDKAYKFMFPADYINHRLTGSVITDYTLAGGSMLFDNDRLEWSEDIVKAFDIQKSKLPEVNKMGTFIGHVKRELADEWGIGHEVKVFLGGQDQKLAALGAGIDERTATVSLGTATAVSALRETENSAVFALDGRKKIYECALNTTGAAIKWLKERLGIDSYDEMNRLAEQSGSSGGVRFESDFTAGAGLSGLSLGTSNGNMIYALYESIARGIAGLLPPKTERVILFGGGAKSGLLCRVIAREGKRKTYVSAVTETACLGAAMLASGGTIKSAGVREIYA
jgi:xylulokinase